MTTMPPELANSVQINSDSCMPIQSKNSTTQFSGLATESPRRDIRFQWQPPGHAIDTSNLLKFTIITAIPLHSPIPTFWQNSLKSQNYRNWEHIVLEFGGTSSTAFWNSGYHPTQVGKAIAPLYSKTEALNKGLSLAKGDIIAFLPLQCTYKHERVLTKVAELMLDPEIDLVYGNLEYHSRGKVRRVIKPGLPGRSCLEMLKNGHLPLEECVFVRREWWQFFGGLETSYHHSAGMARLLDIVTQPGLQTAYIDEVMIRSHRKTDASNTSLSRLLEEVTVFSKRNLLGVYLTNRSLHQRTPSD